GACRLRRLRFSRSAAASRALRAARASALPPLPILPLGAMVALKRWLHSKACPPQVGNAVARTDRSLARAPPPMARIAACSHLVHDLCPKTGFHFSGSCICCRSSVVEHSLGKGEVVSSILTGSTRKALQFEGFQQCRQGRLGRCRQNTTQTSRFDSLRIG